MKGSITILITFLTLWLDPAKAFCQVIGSSDPVLKAYIQTGLNGNMSLQQRQFSLKESLLALRVAKGHFLPTVTFQSDYSLANGGRKIDLPLGDLLNNAYSSLNQLTSSDDFKMIENQKIALLPPVLQDTRIQATIPLINQEIRYTNKIAKEAISGKQAEVDAFKRELIRDIQIAYYNYLQSEKTSQIYQNAHPLLQENLRYTHTLVKNHVGLKSNLLKVQVQLLKNESMLAEARNKTTAARSYFNFLINRPLETTIQSDSARINAYSFHITPEAGSAPAEREEIKQLHSLLRQSALQVRKEKSAAIPQLGAFLNAGMQGSDFRPDNENRYLLGGIQLKWTLFSGFRNQTRVLQAGNDQEALQLKLRLTEQVIELENINKNLELKSAYSKLSASGSATQLAKEFYRETQLRYRHGEALVIELLEAFTSLINSQLDLELDHTNILIKQAELERVTASYSL